MANKPVKITLSQAARQGDTFITIWCETTRKTPRPYSHATNVCGHHVDIKIEDAIARWGPEKRLSNIQGVCSVCGGRDIDVRSGHPPIPGQQGV